MTASATATDTVLIIDFGSQVTQLIARRVREAGVYCEIAPFNAAAEAFERLEPKGVILSGGPASVTAADSPRAPQVVFDSGVPLVWVPVEGATSNLLSTVPEIERYVEPCGAIGAFRG